MNVYKRLEIRKWYRQCEYVTIKKREKETQSEKKLQEFTSQYDNWGIHTKENTRKQYLTLYFG